MRINIMIVKVVDFVSPAEVFNLFEIVTSNRHLRIVLYSARTLVVIEEGGGDKDKRYNLSIKLCPSPLYSLLYISLLK